KFWSHFKPIIDAYSGPMKDEYRFWPGPAAIRPHKVIKEISKSISALFTFIISCDCICSFVIDGHYVIQLYTDFVLTGNINSPTYAAALGIEAITGIIANVAVLLMTLYQKKQHAYSMLICCGVVE
uniref:Uncharacterized protein n=1 Tax=Amphimedon queenslandica TaxID=400682 RepID=A0A1X7URN5_AMPQE